MATVGRASNSTRSSRPACTWVRSCGPAGAFRGPAGRERPGAAWSKDHRDPDRASAGPELHDPTPLGGRDLGLAAAKGMTHLGPGDVETWDWAVTGR